MSSDEIMELGVEGLARTPASGSPTYGQCDEDRSIYVVRTKYRIVGIIVVGTSSIVGRCL